MVNNKGPRKGLLGSKAALRWTQRDDALVVTLPPRLPTAHAAAFKIELAPPSTGLGAR